MYYSKLLYIATNLLKRIHHVIYNIKARILLEYKNNNIIHFFIARCYAYMYVLGANSMYIENNIENAIKQS